MLQGGFLSEMTRREAAQILNIRESAAEYVVKEAHRRIMMANHPDSGGSSYVATKINEAKDMLLRKQGRSGL
jgi:DnaJ homolog subfamily C member 19